MITSDDYFLAFHYCNGIGPKTFSTIENAFEGDITKAWQATPKHWIELGFPKRIAYLIDTHRQSFDFNQTKQALAKEEIQYISRKDSQFPTLLKQIADCPIGLFIKGRLEPSDAKAIAVVGTRKMTLYGREVTERFVNSLTRLGFTIVSGLARGIDGVAHRACIDAGGRTLAVLGCGLDQIYPPEHRHLAGEVVEQGALISEYPPGYLPSPGNFPARNRIVSGLSLGVLVTEGASRSGSKITALTALDQNREVFAVPGPITSLMSSAPAELIQAGAKLVLSERDILNELQIPDMEEDRSRPVPTNGNGHATFSDPTHQTIWQFLIQGTQHIDEIVRTTQLPAPKVTTALTMMELQGQIKNVGNGNYMIR